MRKHYLPYEVENAASGECLRQHSTAKKTHVTNWWRHATVITLSFQWWCNVTSRNVEEILMDLVITPRHAVLLHSTHARRLKGPCNFLFGVSLFLITLFTAKINKKNTTYLLYLQNRHRLSWWLYNKMQLCGHVYIQGVCKALSNCIGDTHSGSTIGDNFSNRRDPAWSRAGTYLPATWRRILHIKKFTQTDLFQDFIQKHYLMTCNKRTEVSTRNPLRCAANKC